MARTGESAWGAAASAATRYGNVAMERLINDILKLGGRREDLEIKLVGGGRVLAELRNDIGARNIEFVRQYVREEGFKVVSEDLGDVFARRVVYFPQTGRMRVRKLNTAAGRDAGGARAPVSAAARYTRRRRDRVVLMSTPEPIDPANQADRSGAGRVHAADFHRAGRRDAGAAEFSRGCGARASRAGAGRHQPSTRWCAS